MNYNLITKVFFGTYNEVVSIERQNKDPRKNVGRKEIYF